MDPKQTAGWFLILVGLLIIFWSLYSSFQIFTGQKMAPDIFMAEQQPASELKAKTGDLENQAQQLVSQALQGQLKSILPPDSVSKSLNLFSWSIFIWILLFGGGQIAFMGVRLIK